MSARPLRSDEGSPLLSGRRWTAFQVVLAFILSVCFVVFVVRSLSWPLVNDAVLIRYATFLLQHHFAPYREIVDYNLPGSYFADWMVVHTLGASALAWRIYDLSLLAIIGVAMVAIARPYSRFAGFFAAVSFALFHGRDGIAQAGQRDLAMAALIFVGAAILLCPPKRLGLVHAFLFGLCVGAAATIKPTAVLALPLVLLPRVGEDRASSREVTTWQRLLRDSAVSLAGFFVAPLAALAWLWHTGSVGAFWTIMSQLVPMHERLGYLGFWPLFTRIFTASHGILAALTILLMLCCRDAKLARLRLFLAAGAVAGLLSYFVQAKGYPYHRYPFVAFLFLLASIELVHALRWRGYRRYLGVGGLVFLLVLGVLSTVRLVHDRWPAEPTRSLARDLNSLGGAALSGDVQCIDTIDSCLATLYDLRLVQSTGMMYDEFLFIPAELAGVRHAAVLAKMRRNFLGQLSARPPRVLIVTPWLFPMGPDGYTKIERWPEFERFLDGCYGLQVQRDFVATINTHPGYRLYVRRPDYASGAGCAAAPPRLNPVD